MCLCICVPVTHHAIAWVRDGFLKPVCWSLPDNVKPQHGKKVLGCRVSSHAHARYAETETMLREFSGDRVRVQSCIILAVR